MNSQEMQEELLRESEKAAITKLNQLRGSLDSVRQSPAATEVIVIAIAEQEAILEKIDDYFNPKQEFRVSVLVREWNEYSAEIMAKSEEDAIKQLRSGRYELDNFRFSKATIDPNDGGLDTALSVNDDRIVTKFL